MGGAMAAWRLMRESRRRRGMFDRLLGEAAADDPRKVIRLERDPETGVYAPRRER